jgi:hypothetical protein
MQTDRTIPNDILDTIIRGNEQGTCVVTDAAILGERNVIEKEDENIPKYNGLRAETQCV